VSDRDCLTAHQDLLHKQPQDLLAFGHVQRVRPRLQPGTETSECFNQPQIPGLITSGRLQRLQFGLRGLVLLAKFRHARAKLVQTHQAFLVSNQQAVHALRQSCMVSVQLILSLLQWIRIPGRFQPAGQFVPDDPGIFQ
jgi:hypothetical protein